MDMAVCASLPGQLPSLLGRSGTGGSLVLLFLIFLRNHPTGFHDGYTLYNPTLAHEIPNSLHPPQPLLLFGLCESYPVMASICMSLMISDDQHLVICLLATCNAPLER